MSDSIRWGIIGTGRVARQFAQGLRSVPDASLVAVTDRIGSAARAFAGEFGVQRVYERSEELAAEGDVDVVYIATPHVRHKDDCLLCLGAGKPVLCEKPMTLNAEEAVQIASLARAKRLFCMEAMWMRCIPLVRKARELVRSGAIGGLRMLMADFGSPEPFDPQSRLYNAALGGGALLDRGVYGISLAQFLLGSPAQVAGQACIGETGVDEQCALTLRYSGGELAAISASLCGWTSNEARLAGTEGEIVLHEPFCRPERLTVRKRQRPGPAPAGAAGLKSRIRSALKQNRLVRSVLLRLSGCLSVRDTVAAIEGNGYNYEAAEVIRCLREGVLESDLIPLDDTIAVMRTMDSLRRDWKLRYPSEGDPACPAAAEHR